MAISRTQPMRPAEIDLLDYMDSAEGNITQLQEGLEETNRGLEQEVINRQQADTALGTRIDVETLARTQADTALGTRIDNETLARTQADTALDTRLGTAENDIETLQVNFAAIPVFEYGANKNNNVPAASSIGVDITFTDEKQSTPYVLVSVECVEGEESPVSNCYGIIVSANATGFSVRLHNLDSVNAETVTINWLAIGA